MYLRLNRTDYDAADGTLCVKAAAICSMLNNWSGMDVEKSVAYILSCQVPDFSF